MQESARTASRVSFISVTAIGLLLPMAAAVLRSWDCRIFSRQAWDYGSAGRAIVVRNLLSGAPLYPDFRAAPYHDASPYNPLCYYAAAPLARLFQPDPLSPLEAGRLLVVSATIAVALLIFLNARRSGARRDAATIAALAFIFSPMLQPWGFEFHVDLPAVACELAGLYAFQAGAQYAALAFFELAFFAKQGFVAGLLATLAYLWLASRRLEAIKLGAVSVVIAAATILVLQTRYPYYLLNTFDALTPIYDPVAAVYLFAAAVVHHLPVIVLALVYLLRFGFKRNVLALFWLLAVCHDLFTAARWGSNSNYFLPTLAASTMLAALELTTLIEKWQTLSKWIQVGAGVIMAVLVFAEPWSPRDRGARALGAFGLDRACRVIGCPDPTFPFDRRAIRTMAHARGPVFTDLPELLLIHASPEMESVDLMPLLAMHRNGHFNDVPLLADFERRRFAMLALDDQLLSRNYRGVNFFWPRLRKAIEDNYVLVPGLGPPFLMVPRADHPSWTTTRNTHHSLFGR